MVSVRNYSEVWLHIDEREHNIYIHSYNVVGEYDDFYIEV